MKLSEAIRLGAMMKPQAFDGVLLKGQSVTVMGERVDIPETICTCAIGAALDAIGRLPRIDYLEGCIWTDPGCFFPILNKAAPCPVPGCEGADIDWALPVSHLNEEHRWTRERIADWVESVENSVPVSVPEGDLAAV